MPVVIGFAPPSMHLSRATGDVTYAECQRAIDQMLATPGSAGATCIFVETSAIRSTPSITELRAIVRDFKPLVARGVRHMAIVSDQLHVYGVARMFSVFAEALDFDVMAFRTTEEAERWLRDRCKAAPPAPPAPPARSPAVG